MSNLSSEYRMSPSSARKGDVNLEYTNASCGITTAWGLDDNPWDFVLRVLGARGSGDRRSREAFILFSDLAGKSSRGSTIAAFIKERPWLGPLVETSAKTNPNSGNLIIAYLWEPDHGSLAREALFLEGRFERTTRK